MKRSLLGVSVFTLVGLYILLSIVVLGVCLIAGLNMVYGIITCIIILILQFLLSPFITDLTMKWFYKCDFKHEMPEYLTKFVKEVCEKYKMKYPRIGYIDDGAPNAFTYGHTKNDARIVVTRGDFELLTEEEVKAVVAHELGHATHYDMLFMTVAQLVPLLLYLVFEVCTSTDSSNNSKDGNGAAIIGVVAYVLYIISQYIVLWLSRTREYYADEFSIKETKNPNALASALVKIGFGLISNSDSKEGNTKKHSTNNIGALGLFDKKSSKSLIVMTNNKTDDKSAIKNAMKWEMWNPWAFLYQLASTHPLISKRLLFISDYSKEYGQEPYVVFDLKKPESYVDDFFLEVLIKYLPGFFFLITVILGIVGFVVDGLPVFLMIGIGLLLTTIFAYIAFKRAHRGGYEENTVENLLSEVKVSGVTSISCTLKGKIIGRGDPGYMFNEDFMIQDDTGIIFADYNTPLWILNKIFAIFKNGKNMDKDVVVRGWYRRSPVPYVEIYDFVIDGKKHKTGIYTFNKVMYALLLIISVVLIVLGIM